MSRQTAVNQGAWRAQVLRADGTVKQEILKCAKTRAEVREVRNFFDTVRLSEGETARYQIRYPGQSRFVTWCTRGVA